MSWIWITITAYFFGALTVVLDKYLLKSEKISSPAVYAFYVAIFGMGVLMFWPLGLFFQNFVLRVPPLEQFVLIFENGLTFLGSLIVLYFAIKKSEASKVIPVVFSVVPIITMAASFLVGVEKLSLLKIFGIVFLIFGGLLISFDLPLKLNKKKFFEGFYLSILAGVLLGFSTFLLKLVYDQQNFFNGYVWTRFTTFLSAFLMLLIPAWRKKIFGSFSGAKHNKKENVRTGTLFVFNKILGGSSSALINLAIGIGSVTIISSLISLQYVFVLILAVLFAKKLPHIFEERLYFWDWAQKVAAILIIAAGMFLIS